MDQQLIDDIISGLSRGHVIPYLGPGVLSLSEAAAARVPASPQVLVEKLTAKASVPHKILKNLTAAAQFIENFKHRKTLQNLMLEAFSETAPPTALHHYLASLGLPLIVHAWYDDLMQQALAPHGFWGTVQGVSQSEFFGTWVHYFNADGTKIEASENDMPGEAWKTLLYEPIGAVSPAGNFLVSDTDFVEVLTEIDIQTPIPDEVKNLRTGRNFLFLGCRFNTQLERIFAFEIMKRSSKRHWAILPEEPTRNEKRFMEQYDVTRIDMPLADFVSTLKAEMAA